MWLRHRRGAALGAIAVILIAIGANWISHARTSRSTDKRPGWGPLPHGVRVEVMNTGTMAGASRVGAQLLRHAGFDVFQGGNGDSAARRFESNRILVRRGDTTGVGRILEALGGGEVVDAPDATRLVDLTVYVGRKFAPPPDRTIASP